MFVPKREEQNEKKNKLL